MSNTRRAAQSKAYRDKRPVPQMVSMPADAITVSYVDRPIFIVPRGYEMPNELPGAPERAAIEATDAEVVDEVIEDGPKE